MNKAAIAHADEISRASTLVIRIQGIGGRLWKRNVAKGGRIGPWLQAKFEVLNQTVWEAKTQCLDLVIGRDKAIPYVGISRNCLKDRWRASPAYDADTMQRLPENQLFHSQCWKHIERETDANPSATFEPDVPNAHERATPNADEHPLLMEERLLEAEYFVRKMRRQGPNHQDGIDPAVRLRRSHRSGDVEYFLTTRPRFYSSPR